METTTKAKAPGLTWRKGKPIWRASRAAIKAGFKPAGVNLTYFANNDAALIARCHRLTAEANEWLTGQRGRTPFFDGTIGSLINFWQVEPSSPYHDLEPATLRRTTPMRGSSFARSARGASMRSTVAISSAGIGSGRRRWLSAASRVSPQRA
jgi:hypothetical protein